MDKKKLIEKIKSQLKTLVSDKKFGEVKSGDLLINYEGDELIVGLEVFTVDQDGNNIPLPDGEYTLDDGVVIAVVNGKVEAIVNGEATEEPAPIEEEPVIEEEMVEEPQIDLSELLKRIEKLEAMINEFISEKQKIELQRQETQPEGNPIKVEPTVVKALNKNEFDLESLRERIKKNRNNPTKKIII